MKIMRKITIAMIIATMCIGATACGTNDSSETNEVVEKLVIPEPTKEETISSGSGEYNVPFSVTIETGEIFYFDLYSSESTVGAAINGKNIAIINEDGIIESALHNEPLAGKSWNFYIDGYLSEANIMETPIEEGREYAIVVE